MIERELFHSGLLPAAWAYGLGAALAAVVLGMLWQEIQRNRHPLRWLLLLTRAGMVAVLTILLAQPNLLITTRQQHSGKTLSLVDDTASMFAVDAGMTPQDQASLARLMALPEMAARPAEFQQLADTLRQEGEALAGLNDAVRSALVDIRKGLPWSDRAQETVTASQPALKTLKEFLGTLEGRNGLDPAARQLAKEAIALLGPGKERGSLLFAGSQPLQQADWEALETTAAEAGRKLEQLHERLLARQAEADREFLAAEGRQAAINGLFRDLTRYGLARRVIAGAVPLAGAETLNLYHAAAGPVEASAAAPRTDLVQALAAVLHDRPLELINAVYGFSDGGQNCLYDMSVLDIYRKRGVPLVMVGVGTERADEVLMLADMECPRLVTTRAPLAVALDLKVAVPAGTRIDVRYDVEEQAGAAAPKPAGAPSARPTGSSGPTGHALPYTETIVTAGKGWLHHQALLRMARPGFQRLRIEISMPEPAAKLTRRVPVYVSPDKPGVLLVAERPDPLSMSLQAQKRFGLNVFPVYTYGKETNAKRGDTKSLLPKAAKDWSRYDLIVLMGRPFPGFTKDDAAAIAEAVRTKGVSVLVVGDATGGYTAALEAALGRKAPAGAPALLDRPAGIVPADDVLHLPMMQLSADLIRNQNAWTQFQAPGTWRAVPEQDVALIRHPAAQAPVMTLGFCGSGRVVYCGLGEWERMNEWRTASFESLVTRLVLDLLVPDGQWEEGKAGLGVYPDTGVPGRPTVILARSANAADPTMELKITGPDGKTTALPLEGRDGWFRRQHVFADEGVYTLAAGGAERPVEVRRLESSETRDLSLREDFLRDVAAAAGGTYVSVRDLPDALKPLSVKTRDSIRNRTIRTLDFVMVWLILFLILASADFALRRQVGKAV